MRSMAGVLALACLLAAALTGCGKVRGTVAPNRPPETTLWVTGDLDTVTHTARFFWDGQDADGTISGFEYKWIYPLGAQPAGYDSNAWTFTTVRDSLFRVYTPDGVDFPTFVVRAIDNDGTPDPTPARQSFAFSNLAPTVDFTITVPDTTLPVATFDWSATDPDGDIRLAHYRLWLDGAEDRAVIVTGNRHTFVPADFEDGSGMIPEATRTAYVQTIDDGGRASLPDSFSWFVRRPAGTVLLIDELPSTVAGAPTGDAFYRLELDNRVGAGNYTVVDLEQGTALRTPDDIRETLLLFRSVFWYAEQNPSFSPVLQQAGDPIRAYLAAGGNFFYDGSRLVGTGGALDNAFAQDVLGSTGFRVNELNGTTNFTISPGQFLTGASADFDSLRCNSIASGIESFLLANAGDAAFVAPPGTLDTLHTDDWPVAVNRTYGTSGGRIVYFPFPLRFMNQSFSGHPGRAAVELRKVFTLFGLP